MDKLKQQFIEMNAIAFQKTEELNNLKVEIEKLKSILQYQEDLDKEAEQKEKEEIEQRKKDQKEKIDEPD